MLAALAGSPAFGPAGPRGAHTQHSPRRCLGVRSPPPRLSPHTHRLRWDTLSGPEQKGGTLARIRRFARTLTAISPGALAGRGGRTERRTRPQLCTVGPLDHRWDRTRSTAPHFCISLSAPLLSLPFSPTLLAGIRDPYPSSASLSSTPRHAFVYPPSHPDHNRCTYLRESHEEGLR